MNQEKLREKAIKLGLTNIKELESGTRSEFPNFKLKSRIYRAKSISFLCAFSKLPAKRRNNKKELVIKRFKEMTGNKFAIAKMKPSHKEENID